MYQVHLIAIYVDRLSIVCHLGTYIVEFEAGKRILDEVLSSEETVNQTVEKLVAIAKTCQFEGWLMNIECKVDPEKMPLLK